jgi:sialate O-acetylesterase
VVFCKFKVLQKHLILLFLLIPVITFGQLSMPRIFADNMILQRDKRLPVWGNALPGKIVTVKLQNRLYQVTAGANGKWKVLINPLHVGASFEMDVSAPGEKSIRLTNIKAGDVWICAGQSNMNFILSAAQNGNDEIQHLNNENIREFRADMPAGVLNPENKDNSRWISAIGQNAETFSAVAYYFAKRIQVKENVPVGIVLMACGNTRAESWADSTIIEGLPALEPLLSYWRKNKNSKDVNINHIPGKFYNNVVQPVIPFAAKGVLWYQGESNTLPDNSGRQIPERAAEYKTLLRLLITSWRGQWGNSHWPFCIVQLPNYTDPSGDIRWAEIRQAQLEISQELPDVGLVTTIDVGDSHNIHPVNKAPVGDRAAFRILASVYHHQLDTISGPVAKKLKIRHQKAMLYFKYAESGLHGKNGVDLKGFEIADRSAPEKFVTAFARISGNQVIVWSSDVLRPVAVRYAWADDPPVSLFNTAGLPASPFLIKIK